MIFVAKQLIFPLFIPDHQPEERGRRSEKIEIKTDRHDRRKCVCVCARKREVERMRGAWKTVESVQMTSGRQIKF